MNVDFSLFELLDLERALNVAIEDMGERNDILKASGYDVCTRDIDEYQCLLKKVQSAGEEAKNEHQALIEKLKQQVAPC